MQHSKSFVKKYCSGLNISTEHRILSAKNQVMSDESFFTMDTVVRCEVIFFLKLSILLIFIIINLFPVDLTITFTKKYKGQFT